MPIIESASADPHVHAVCMRIAKKCVWIIQSLLREEERIEALRSFYAACREELDKKPGATEL